MTVPSGIYVPGTYVEITNKGAGALGNTPFRVCVVGEHAAKYTGEVVQYQRVLSEADAYLKYGVSISYEMLRGLFRNIRAGSNVEVYCVSYPISTLTGSTTYTGNTCTVNVAALSKSGTITGYANGELFTVRVNSTDTATVIGDAIVDAVADIRCTIQIGNTSGALAVTSKAASSATIVNTDLTPISLALRSYDGGPQFDISSVPYKNITLNPVANTITSPNSVDMADLVAVLPDSIINLFVNPYQDSVNYGLLKTEIDRRFGSTVQLEGHQIMTAIGSASSIITAMGTAAYNKEHLTMWDGGYKRPSPYHIQSASVAGIMASSISEDPAVPMQDLAIAGMYPELLEDKRTFAELNALVPAGVAIGATDTTSVRTLRLTTTYITTDGFVDASYRDVNTIFTTSYLRQDILRLIASKFKNYKLADDGIQVASGQNVATPGLVRAALLGWFKEKELLAIVENYDQFAAELVVERDSNDRTRINATIPTDVVNQFRIFGGELAFIL